MHSFNRSIRCCVAAAAVATAGCAGQSSGSPALPESAPSQVAAGRAWMAPQAARSNLAYVADYESNAVFVFKYTQNAMVFAGYIPLGSTPIAECVDKAQDVWVLTSSRLMLEFAHGGTTPIRTLGVSPSLFPAGCSIDAATGNLAVAGSDFDPGFAGAVFVYKNAKGVPLEVADSQYELSDCAYDGKGNLYADRDVINTDLSVDILRRGAKAFQTVTTNQSFRRPGGIQWEKPYLVVADSDDNVVYRFKVASQISVVDTITFNQSTLIGFFAIYRDRILVPRTSADAPHPSIGEAAGGYLSTYKYPAGGNRIRTISNMSYPVAVVVSFGPKGTSL